MRIVAWNCQMGFAKKADALGALKFDVAVIPECSEAAALAFGQSGYEALWFGSNPVKGLGVFSREGWKLRALPQPEQKWIAAIAVDAPTPFLLIAVWACQVGSKKTEHYIGQVYRSIVAHAEWFGGLPVVLAGDLNSNAIWDAERPVGNHSDVVAMLDGHGLVSGYHAFFLEEHGAESRPTIYLYRHRERPFHLDYVFVPRAWASRAMTVEVGEHARWLKLSDHCPVIVDVEPVELISAWEVS